MAIIFDKCGKKIHVELETDWFSRNCPLYADGVGLRKCYILNLYKGKTSQEYKNDDGRSIPNLEIQIEYWDNPPTEEQIMYKMWKNGLSRYDIATIEQGYMLDWIEEEEN
jgi:hypothetical protein